MAQGTLKIHTENILPIIKKWLYSEKDIFVRELVSNACDALVKIKRLKESGELPAEGGELRIDITLDKEAKKLIFSDTGIGMSAEEVEKYIAQIAFSGAEEFLAKYKSQGQEEGIIGHFGLGFYSAYMVAEQVEIDTLSYLPDSRAVFWSCDGSSAYEIDEGKRATRGTSIALTIEKEGEEFLDEAKIREILLRYCAFLPFPIYLNGSLINAKEPLWIKSPTQCTDQEYLEFYRQLYPFEADPLFWIHLNVDYPFHLKGILYFPKIHKRFDWTKSSIKLFCNRVFVSDNCKDLIPDYLMVLKGAIDSPDIPLNVSRSYLQMDRTVRQLAQHISKKVADRLTTLYQTEKEKFFLVWPDIEVLIKLGILQDEKFYERTKEFLVWKNLEGAWTTLEEYEERHGEKYKHKVFYTSDPKLNAPFLALYREKEIEVLVANPHIDNALMSHLEAKHSPTQFQRVDGGIEEAILDKEREKTLLDAQGRTEAAKIADFFRSALALDHLKIEAKSLASENVPAFLVLDERYRRMRDYLALSEQSLADSPLQARTLVINTNSPIISSLYTLKEHNPALAKEVAHHLYELSLLSSKELDPSALAELIDRSHRILKGLIS